VSIREIEKIFDDANLFDCSKRSLGEERKGLHLEQRQEDEAVYSYRAGSVSS
jgi:hypothetical protein